MQERQGLIEVADGGTLFLDEIGDMDIAVQAQFLKVLEEKQFRRLGEVKLRRSEFRIICATNQNLQEKIRAGHFRKDLYFRINVLPIHLLPIRERPEDFQALVGFFLRHLGMKEEQVISPSLIKVLGAYSWPGNIRELKNVLERALLLSRGQSLIPEHFPGLEIIIPDYNNTDAAINLKKIEELHIKKTLEKYKGSVEKASVELGISRATLYRKIKQFNIKL